MRVVSSPVPLFLALLAVSPQLCLSQQGAFPWHAGDRPPSLGGVSLGDPRTRIEATLGRPQRTESMGQGTERLAYPQRGLAIVVSTRTGAAVIQATSRDGGEIGGVRVGDTRESVIRRWGAPRAGQGPVGLYLAGEWAVSVQLDAKRAVVEQLGVGRVIGRN